MQDLTPLEIQKQTFSKSFKGYQPEEVRGYLHLVAEEIERLVRDVDRLSRENVVLREELEDHNQRERILKDTLLSAQKVSEEVKANARKEGELIVKDAELLSERLVSQAMTRVRSRARDSGSEGRAPRGAQQAAGEARYHPAAPDARRRAGSERASDHVDVSREE